MTQHVALNKGSVAIEPFFDATQELLSGALINFQIVAISDTAIRVPGGPGHSQVGASIGGFYRYRSANTDAAHPGGAAGLYDVYVTGTLNDFTGPDPNIDLTDYSFGLAIRAVGSPPTTPLYRKVAEATWDGSKITGVRRIDLPSGVEIGDMKFSARVAEHAGWIKADGRALAPGVYPALRAILISDAMPYGNDAGNPRIPNPQGRAVVGVGAGQGLTARTPGQSGGAETHVILPGEMPVHNHGGNTDWMDRNAVHSHGGATGGADRSLDHTHGYTHTQTYDAKMQGGSVLVVNADYVGVQSAGMDRSIDHLHGIAGADINHFHVISNAGGGAAHPNMQPWLALPAFVFAGPPS